MDTTATVQPAAENRSDVYSIVNVKLIEQLEKGIVPWQKPWTEAGLPKNIISGKYYRGINMMLLSMVGYEHNHFITYKQLQGVGGKVKKGERGHMVVFWTQADQIQNTQEDTDKAKEQRKKPILRYYYVFNVVQCENVPERYLQLTREIRDIPSCETILKTMPQCPPIKHKEQRAYYNVKEDFVNMPRKRSFKDDDSYYATLFHELVHSTGHESRLNRTTLTEMSEFGGEIYSMEELVAEIGGCYLMSYASIDSQFQQNVAYIQGWLAKLKSDKRFVFVAARAAQKAADYILNMHQSQEEEQENEQ